MMKTKICIECQASFVPDDDERVCMDCEVKRKQRLKKFTDIIDKKEVHKQNANTKRHSNQLHT